jgi:Mn2+/Fe2+ NRAMP family transporter
VQVFAGLILPSAIIFLQLLLNDRELLGDRWVNPAMEQRHQLDDHRCPLCPVAALGCAGDASQSFQSMR